MILTPFQISNRTDGDEPIRPVYISLYDSTKQYQMDINSIHLEKVVAAVILFISAVYLPYQVTQNLRKAYKYNQLESRDFIIKYSYFYQEYKPEWYFLFSFSVAVPWLCGFSLCFEETGSPLSS